MAYLIESVGDVPEYTEPNSRVSSREEIDAWLAAHAHGPIRQYNALAADDVPSFAIGENWCGWFHVFTKNERFWYVEENNESGNIDVWAYGDQTSVSRRTTLSMNRLAELLAHYLQSEQRPAARWVDEQGQPENSDKPISAVKPQPHGRYTRALLRALESGQPSNKTNEAVLALVAQVDDDDLAAYLHCIAHLAYLHQVKLHDFWPGMPAFSRGKIELGTLAGGEPVFYERGRIVMVDEEGSREVYSGLEEFLAEWWSRANDDGEATSLDPFL